MTIRAATSEIVILFILQLAVLPAHAAVKCTDVAQTSHARIVEELAQLRLKIEETKAAGDSEASRTYARLYKKKLNETVALGVSTSEISSFIDKALPEDRQARLREEHREGQAIHNEGDLGAWSKSAELKVGESWIHDISFSVQGSFLGIAASRERGASLWSMTSRQQVHKFFTPNSDVGDIQSDKAESVILMTSHKTTAQLLDLKTMKDIGEPFDLKASAFRPSDQPAKDVTIATKKEIVVRDIHTDAILSRVSAPYMKYLAYTPDAKDLISVGESSEEFKMDIFIWNADTLELKNKFSLGVSDYDHNSYALSANGRYLAIGANGSTEYEVLLVDVQTGKIVWRKNSDHASNRVSFGRRDNDVIFSTAVSAQLYDVETGDAIQLFEDSGATTFSGDGNSVVTTGHGSITY